MLHSTDTIAAERKNQKEETQIAIRLSADFLLCRSQLEDDNTDGDDEDADVFGDGVLSCYGVNDNWIIAYGKYFQKEFRPTTQESSCTIWPKLEWGTSHAINESSDYYTTFKALLEKIMARV